MGKSSGCTSDLHDHVHVEVDERQQRHCALRQKLVPVGRELDVDRILKKR